MADITRHLVLNTAEDYEQVAYELQNMVKAMRFIAEAEERRDDRPQMAALCTLIDTAEIFAHALHTHCFFELAKAIERRAYGGHHG